MLANVAVAAGQPKPPPSEPTTLRPIVEVATATDGKLPAGVRLPLGSDKFREANYIRRPACPRTASSWPSAVVRSRIRFLDVATGKEVRRIGIREYLRTQQLLWTPDGTQIITTGYNGINVWDAKDGRLIRQATNPNKDGRDGMIHLSADGKFVAVGTPVRERERQGRRPDHRQPDRGRQAGAERGGSGGHVSQG